METTISVFEAHYVKALAIRQERMMDMGQSVSFGMTTNEGRRKMWNTWTSTVYRVNYMLTTMFSDTVHAISNITWNGKIIDKSELKKQFMRLFGRRSVE